MGAEEVGAMVLGQSELSEQAMRALELKGDLPQRIDGRFNLGITVEDFTRPEFWWMRRMRSWRSGGTAGPVAAQFSYLTLNLVAGVLAGTQIAVVENLLVGNVTAAALQYQVYTAVPAVLGTLQNAQPADDRVTGSPVFEARMNSAVAAPVSIFAQQNFHVQGGDSILIPGPWILTGNVMLVVGCTTVNTAFEASFCWRERLLLSTEK